jgi:TorA maturation chaperone TorD
MTQQAIFIQRPDMGEELERAELYGLLARLWIAPPDAPLLGQFAAAATEAPERGAYLERPWQGLVAAMRSSSVAAAAEEYEALFQAVGRAELFLYGSYYLSGALNDKPLVALRDDLTALGLARGDLVGETEDHVACVFEVMRYLIAGDDVELCNLEQQRRFFRAHVQSWLGEACDAVERHPAARLYAALAAFTRAFVEVETLAFDIVE